MLIRSTEPHIPRPVQFQFSKFTVLCAAITRALHSTTNPVSGVPYSIFDPKHFETLLLRSGLFAKTGMKTIFFSTHKTGHDFCSELGERLFGFSPGYKVTCSISSVLNGLNLQIEKMKKDGNIERTRIGHCVFILNYLDQKTSIEARFTSVDYHSHQKQIEKGVCQSGKNEESFWIIRVDKYRLGSYLK